MKLAQLLNDQLHVALKKLNDQNLPLKTAFALKGINKRISEEVSKYEEIRQEALQKLGKKDADGNLELNEHQHVEFDLEARNTFMAQLSELVNLEVDVGSISIDDLADAKITATDLMALDGLIK